MRFPSKWLRSHPLLALFILGLVAATVAFVLWPRERVTLANFQKIDLGMSQADVTALLGTPGIQVAELGFITDEKTYSVNFSLDKDDLRRKGHRDYLFQQWDSREIVIVVISDQDGHVVCKYSNDGRKWSWRELIPSSIRRLF